MLTYDQSNRLLTMYQDGKEVGKKTIARKLLDTKRKEFLYWNRNTKQKRRPKKFYWIRE